VNEEALAHWEAVAPKTNEQSVGMHGKVWKGRGNGVFNSSLQSHRLLKPSIRIYPEFNLRTSDPAKYEAATTTDIP